MKTLSLRAFKKVALFTSAAVLAFSFGIPSMSAASTESEQNIVAKAYPTLSSSNVGTSYTQLGDSMPFSQRLTVLFLFQ